MRDKAEDNGREKAGQRRTKLEMKLATSWETERGGTKLKTKWDTV